MHEHQTVGIHASKREVVHCRNDSEPLLAAIEQCLVNVLQHSGVTHAELSVTRDDTRVIATVVDEGDGFDEATVPEDRFGLRDRRFGGA